MTQLDIAPQLYEKIAAHASQTGQSVEEWLLQAAVGETNLSELNEWFVRLIAHDLRTPLAAIVTSADILQHYQDRLTDERRNQHLNTIQFQVRVLNLLLDNVMVIQKTETGLLVLEPAPQDLKPLCQQALAEAAAVVYHPLEMTFQTDDPPPQVVLDEYLLKLALVNILSNANQYSPEGSSVAVTLTVAGQQAIVEVQDQGIGIPPAEQAAVFDLFYRATNARTYNGKGLGLAAAQRIVRLHGGTLTLDSALDQGTRVRLSLPIAD